MVIVTCYQFPTIVQSSCVFTQETSCYNTCCLGCNFRKDSTILSDENKEVTKPIATTSSSIYPNPASQVVTLEANQNFKTIRIFSLDGKLIFQQEKLDQRQLQIPINTWTAGMYLVHYYFEDQTAIKQLIVESKN